MRDTDGTVTDTSLSDIRIPASVSEVNNVIFENDYDNTDKGGGSIQNEFTYVNGSNGAVWDLNRVYSQPQPAAQ